MRAWNEPQKKWLDMIARQMKREVVVDAAALDQEPFRDRGGLKNANKVFDGKAEDVLGAMSEAVWEAVA